MLKSRWPYTHWTHINEDPPGLEIYVPMDKTSQEFCFASLLPINLAHQLMRDQTTHMCNKVDSSAVTALTTLLNVGLSAANLILEYQGIIWAPILNEDAAAEVYRPKLVNDDAALSQQSACSDSSTRSSLTPATGIRGSSSADTDDEVTSVVVKRAQPAPAPHRLASPARIRYELIALLQQLPIEDAQYLALLNRAVVAARRATFPTRRSFDMSYMLFDVFDLVSRFLFSSRFKRNKTIGAAGELHVCKPPVEITGRLRYGNTLRVMGTIWI